MTKAKKEKFEVVKLNLFTSSTENDERGMAVIGSTVELEVDEEGLPHKRYRGKVRSLSAAKAGASTSDGKRIAALEKENKELKEKIKKQDKELVTNPAE